MSNDNSKITKEDIFARLESNYMFDSFDVDHPNREELLDENFDFTENKLPLGITYYDKVELTWLMNCYHVLNPEDWIFWSTYEEHCKEMNPGMTRKQLKKEVKKLKSNRLVHRYKIKQKMAL